MIEINVIDKIFYPVLAQLGITEDDIMLIASTDMQGQMLLGSCVTVLTKDCIYSVSGQTAVEHSDEKRISDAVFIKKDVLSFPLDSFSEINVESLSTTATVTVKTDDGYKAVCHTTNKYKNDMFLFVKYVKAYKEKGVIEPDEKDFKKDNFCPKCGNRYPDPARKICPACMDKRGLLARLWEFTKGYRTSMILVLSTLVLASILGVITPYISSAFFYDEVLGDQNSKFYGRLGLVLSLVVGTTVLKLLINTLSGCITSKVSGNVIYKLKKTIFSSINRLSMSFFTGRQTGGLMTQVNNDANSIYWFFVDGVPYFLVNTVQIIAVFVIMLVLNPLLAVLAVSVVPAFAFIIVKLVAKMRSLFAKRYASNRAMNATLSDSLSGVRVVKAFAREDEECRRFNSRSERFEYNNRAVTVYNNTRFPIANAVMYMSTIIVWGVGGWMAMTGYGGMEYGELTAFVAYVGMMNSPLFMFVDMSYQFSSCMNALQRLFEIADAEPDVKEPENPVECDVLNGKVEFCDVEFSYTKERKIIDGVSFTVEPGEALGIVGHTGAGKSTLANLLIRLYDVTSGSILIDGVNVKDYSVKSLRKNIAIVSQETYLFVGTVLENIRYANPEASYEQVVTASKIAGAHDFIVKLPDGYNTKIGFGNKDLSGGERQRISIARAILKNPKILILDEATAAMDTETERKIQTALNRLSAGRTTIMIAHRLSTLKDADKLIVIENGKMPEHGTHKELLMKKGIYHKLYKLQMEAMKNIGIEE